MSRQPFQLGDSSQTLLVMKIFMIDKPRWEK